MNICWWGEVKVIYRCFNLDITFHFTSTSHLWVPVFIEIKKSNFFYPSIESISCFNLAISCHVNLDTSRTWFYALWEIFCIDWKCRLTCRVALAMMFRLFVSEHFALIAITILRDTFQFLNLHNIYLLRWSSYAKLNFEQIKDKTCFLWTDFVEQEYRPCYNSLTININKSTSEI